MALIALNFHVSISIIILVYLTISMEDLHLIILALNVEQHTILLKRSLKYTSKNYDISLNSFIFMFLLRKIKI